MPIDCLMRAIGSCSFVDSLDVLCIRCLLIVRRLVIVCRAFAFPLFIDSPVVVHRLVIDWLLALY